MDNSEDTKAGCISELSSVSRRTGYRCALCIDVREEDKEFFEAENGRNRDGRRDIIEWKFSTVWKHTVASAGAFHI